jgi:hypothetical protein
LTKPRAIKRLLALLSLALVFFCSCAGQNGSAFVPLPEPEYFIYEKTIDIGVITETKDGGARQPAWFSAYISGGIEAVERLERYNGKYMFIGNSEGLNFAAMDKWTENFSPSRDFALLAAPRIERRMISWVSRYPDHEYGLFFETMVKKAYSAVYQGVVKEDTYWVKSVKNEGGEQGWEDEGVYVFFVLLSIDKITMQSVISNMIAESLASVTPTPSQRSTINRLRQNFFEGF